MYCFALIKFIPLQVLTLENFSFQSAIPWKLRLIMKIWLSIFFTLFSSSLFLAPLSDKLKKINLLLKLFSYSIVFFCFNQPQYLASSQIVNSYEFVKDCCVSNKYSSQWWSKVLLETLCWDSLIWISRLLPPLRWSICVLVFFTKWQLFSFKTTTLFI